MISLQREAFLLRKRLRGFLLKAQFCDALRCLGLIARCTDARKRVCILPQKRSLKNWTTVFGALGFVLGSFFFFQLPPKSFPSVWWKHVFIHVLTVEEKIRVKKKF